MSDRVYAIEKPISGGRDIGCDTCAFRKDATTRREVVNVTKGELCVLGGVPFYCHYTRDGVDFHATDDDAKPDVGDMRICEGWKAEVSRLAQNPVWRENRSFKIAITQLALGALNCLTIEGLSKRDSKKHLQTIKQAILILTGKKRMRLRRIPNG